MKKYLTSKVRLKATDILKIKLKYLNFKKYDIWHVLKTLNWCQEIVM